MTLPRRQRRLLEAIDDQLDRADPALTRQFGLFARIWADQPRPAHEQVPGRMDWFWSRLWDVLALAARAAQPVPGPLRPEAGRGSAGPDEPGPGAPQRGQQADGGPAQP
jgi:hypothetical protein